MGGGSVDWFDLRLVDGARPDDETEIEPID